MWNYRYEIIVTAWCVRTGWTPLRWTTANCTASRTSSSSSSHEETTTRALALIHTRTNGRQRIPIIPRAHRRSRSQMAISDFPNGPVSFFSLLVHRYWILIGFTGGSRWKLLFLFFSEICKIDINQIEKKFMYFYRFDIFFLKQKS